MLKVNVGRSFTVKQQHVDPCAQARDKYLGAARSRDQADEVVRESGMDGKVQSLQGHGHSLAWVWFPHMDVYLAGITSFWACA